MLVAFQTVVFFGTPSTQAHVRNLAGAYFFALPGGINSPEGLWHESSIRLVSMCVLFSYIHLNALRKLEFIRFSNFASS